MKNEPLGLRAVASLPCSLRKGLLHGNRLGWKKREPESYGSSVPSGAGESEHRRKRTVPSSSVGQDKVLCREPDTPVIQEVAGGNRGAPWSHLPPF